MKNITILGNCGNAPEQRTTQSGQKVTGFSLAVNDGYGDKKRTLWFRCSIWGKRSDVIAQNVNKGDKLCVTGDLSTDEYEGKTSLTVNVSDFSFAGGGDKSDGNRGGAPAGGASGGHGHLDDEIPFAASWK